MDYSPNRGFESLTDEQLAIIAQAGNRRAQDYLLNKYRNFVRIKASTYFLIGADKEDIVQEGMIGLYKAIRDFNPDKTTSFHVFADLCVTRHIITAIKAATRQKHMPLNSYISLNKPLYEEDSDRMLIDVLASTVTQNPEDMFIHQESLSDIELGLAKCLSKLEKEVLMAYLQDHSYQEIALELQRHVKSVDNALQRVKRKLEKYLEEQERE